MITEQDVYVAYRRAKSISSGKGFRLPKDWDDYFENKMSPKNKEYLIKTTGYFNTTFSNIDIDKYMECGCELFKSFSYHLFLRPKIVGLYKDKDKQTKRKIVISNKSIEDTFDFIETFMIKRDIIKGYNMLQTYCKVKDGHRKTILEHYMKNKIDPLVIVYCIYYKYLVLTDIEREYIYNVTNRYRDLLQDMFQVEEYIKERDNG